jgi:anti-anti-sigma factor
MTRARAGNEPEQIVLVLRLEGDVDTDSVDDLRARIEEVSAQPGRVVVDLCDARHIEHLALARLADLVAQHQRRTPRVVVRGLCEHHVRVLRYCGHDLPVEPLRFAQA